MSKHSPFLICRLTDQFGNLISPYEPGAVTYTLMRICDDKHWSVSILGYIVVYEDEEKISPPIPFCIISSFCLTVPKASSVTFQLINFHVWAISCQHKCTSEVGQIKILISIETYASSQKKTALLVPRVDENLCVIGSACIHADQIFDSTQISSKYCILYNAGLRAEVSQYDAIADGKKRCFRNSDEKKEYRGFGILSPEEVSYYNVFVNGLLQPKKNYILKKGELIFTTQNIPSKGQTVIILFVTWKNANWETVDSTEWQYSVISDGFKKIYTNEDELPEYKSRGIPSPYEVSFFNLYINGVLQPKANYCVRKGMLKLTTEDVPAKGAFVILESVVIRDPERRLFRTLTSSYNAYSNGSKIYTNQDEIAMYGLDGISKPGCNSYQNLFINGIIQPHKNYSVYKSCLILETEDNPSENDPITLQSVSSVPAVPCCKTQFSEKALAHWEKIYHISKYLDDFTQHSEDDPFSEEVSLNSREKNIP
ncbi:MAG: DUF4183 domain-containing protein [Oscillospiraceae bacterium]